MKNTPKITDAMWNGWVGKILYVPLLNLLVLLYVYIPGQDLGLAIIAITLIIRIVLHPSYRSTLKAQRDMQKIQPYIDKVKVEFKDDQKRQSEEMMKLYKEHKVNPLGSCLPLIIQLPIVYALYRVFIAGLDTSSLVHLYSWFPNPPAQLHTVFLNFLNMPNLAIDLTTRNIYLAILAGVAQLVQTWVTMQRTKKTAPQSQPGFNMQSNIMLLFPLVTLGLALTLPSALSLYWATTTIVMTLEQVWVFAILDRQEQKVAEETHYGE
jgi:YidC/Oxa1 family membrane protein insertase